MKKYGVTFREGVSESVIELQMAFDIAPRGESLKTAPGYLGAFEHLRRAIDLIWNKNVPMLIWNEWTELMLRTFIENRESPITGPGASWKTTAFACYANAFYLADPLRTKIIPSSTSIGALREKLWKDILKFFRVSGAGFGNVTAHPHPKIQTIQGDDSSGFFGVAVEQGDIEKAVDRIKGRHAPRVLVGIDEGTGAQPAIVEACVNLSTGCETFQMTMLGNMSSYFNEWGKFSEPENGWSSVNVNSLTWKTRRGGLAVHLDGHLSPNVLAGYRKYPGLIAQEDLDATARQYGENSPRYWIERRGFAPPEGITKTVLSETIIEKFKARSSAVWTGEPVLAAALDPAFEGGDRRVLRFAKCGYIDVSRGTDNGLDFSDGLLMVVCFTEILLLKVDVTSKEPIHYQIARQVREECKQRGIDPKWFAMDTSGEGGGLSSILKREWSWDFLEVEFGGSPSNRPISATNPRPGTEEYVNRVSELWYQFRYGVERGQVRGLDADTCKEFCQREYSLQGPRVKVESKKDMKLRIGHSPDLADAAVIMWELFKVRKPELAGGDVTSEDRRWREFREKMNVFDEDEAYAELEWG